jgi:hypothetical protein
MSINAYIEESGTPIYARIAKALGAQLMRLGLNVLVVKPSGFNQQSFLAFVKGLPANSVYISNAGRNIIAQSAQGQAHAYFEHYAGRMVFLHQDSILSGQSLEQACATLQAWQRIAARSLHLCIEPSSVAALHAVGVANAQLVPHASEFQPTEPLLHGFEHPASFVGHVVPQQYRPSTGSSSVDALIQRLYEKRQADLSAPVQDDLATFSGQALACLGQPADNGLFKQAYTLWLRGQLMHQSMQFRGWVFEQAQLDSLAIFGGDPGYIHGLDRALRIDKSHISYHPPVYEAAAVSHLFRSSAVSLNITSMQFDHAVVNRFHDVFMAGGLCLTDRRCGLPLMTAHHADLSFSTLAQMQERVTYFARPDKRHERAQLIRAVQRELLQNAGYPLLAMEIRSFLQAPSSAPVSTNHHAAERC